MSNEARKTEPDCKEIAKNIDAMNERQLRRYCRLIEMIGQQQMDGIRHKNDVIAELMADNQKLEQQLAIARDNERMLHDRLEEYESERVMKPIDSGWPPCMDVGDGETLGEKIAAFALPAVLVAALIWFVMLIVAMVAAVI